MKPPLILAIETSNPSGVQPAAASVLPGVALVGPGGVLGVEHTGMGGAGTTGPQDDLMPAVQRLFSHLGRVPAELTRVCVSLGPGGFTAVRLAVTAAKMICEVTGAECSGVPTARVVARRVAAAGRPFAVALASKGETSFVTLFDEKGGRVDDGALLDAAGVGRLDIGTLVVDRFVPGSMRAACEARGIAIAAPIFDPVACAEAGAEIAPVDPAMLAPLYPREPEAVTKWRALHGRG